MEEKRLAKLPLVFYLIVGGLCLAFGILTLVAFKGLESVPEGEGIAYALVAFVFAYGLVVAGGAFALYLVAAALKFIQMRYRVRWPAYLCIAFDAVMVLLCLRNLALWLIALLQLPALIDNVKSIKILREEKKQKEENET